MFIISLKHSDKHLLWNHENSVLLYNITNNSGIIITKNLNSTWFRNVVAIGNIVVLVLRVTPISVSVMSSFTNENRYITLNCSTFLV